MFPELTPEESDGSQTSGENRLLSHIPVGFDQEISPVFTSFRTVLHFRQLPVTPCFKAGWDISVRKEENVAQSVTSRFSDRYSRYPLVYRHLLDIPERELTVIS